MQKARISEAGIRCEWAAAADIHALRLPEAKYKLFIDFDHLGSDDLFDATYQWIVLEQSRYRSSTSASTANGNRHSHDSGNREDRHLDF